MPRMQCPYILRFIIRQLQAKDQSIENDLRQLVQLPIKLRRESAKAGVNIFGEPDVVLDLVLVAAYFVTLLSIQ